MRWLKALVMVLAALIVLAIGLLGYGFIKRTEDPNWRLFSVPKATGLPKLKEGSAVKATTKLARAQSSPGKPSAAPWGELELGLAEKCQITQVGARGNRLVLSIGPSGTCRRIIIIDMDTGQVMGTVRPRP